MKIDLILNLWKRDDYWLDKCWEELVDGNRWILYQSHARSDAQSRKGEEYDRHFGIFIVTVGESDEVKCHGLINLGFTLNPTRDLIRNVESYKEYRNRANNGISGYYSFEKASKLGEAVFQRWLGRITCPSDMYPKE
jgi:hypothetical protein